MVSKTLLVALGIIGFNNILKFLICSETVNKMVFILSGSFFLTAQGSKSLKYLLVENEKFTTVLIY